MTELPFSWAPNETACPSEAPGPDGRLAARCGPSCCLWSRWIPCGQRPTDPVSARDPVPPDDGSAISMSGLPTLRERASLPAHQCLTSFCPWKPWRMEEASWPGRRNSTFVSQMRPLKCDHCESRRLSAWPCPTLQTWTISWTKTTRLNGWSEQAQKAPMILRRVRTHLYQSTRLHQAPSSATQ